ncbi:MAG: universal stress protein [Polyangiaceae bacterium]
MAIRYPWRHVLVATDFSKGSDAALNLGRQLAHREGASLTLLHVADVSSLGLGMTVKPENHPEGISVEAFVREGAFREAGAQLDRVGAVRESVKIYVAFGSPAIAIVDEAKKLDADLIVMGTHGRSGLAHLFVGSVAERVVRASAIPVLTVRVVDDDTHMVDEEQIVADEAAG